MYKIPSEESCYVFVEDWRLLQFYTVLKLNQTKTFLLTAISVY